MKKSVPCKGKQLINNDSINICLVSLLPPPYGGIAHWGGLITHYAKKIKEVKITVVNTTPRWRAIHDDGLFKRIAGGGLQLLRDLFLLLAILLFKKIHVVHLTTSGKLGAVRDVGVFLLSWCFRVPLIYHIRFGRIPEISRNNTLEWRLIKFVALRSSSVIAIDEATGRALKMAIPPALIVVIPNCVDFSGLPTINDKVQEDNIALFVGWVVPTKGIFELLESWAKIKPPGWKLKVVGPGSPDYISSLKNKYGECGVEFVGELSHEATMRTMAACELFVLPSYTEGFPNAVVEAMALGKAIIASNVGAIPEMLSMGQCGVLVTPKNCSDLTNALRMVISDKSLRESLGIKARDRALRHYSIVTIFDLYVSVWKSAIVRFKTL